MALSEAGVLERHNVRLLGTPLEAIHMAEDREAFRDLLDRIDQPYAPSFIVEGADDDARHASAEEALDTIGLPAIIRPAFTLGGTGGGIVETEEAYWERVRAGLRASPIKQVMIERCLVGWQEIEYEVMRDARGHVHRRVLDGERGPAGRPHGRLDRRGAGPDPDRRRSTSGCAARRSRSSARWASRAAATSSSRSPRTAPSTR